MCIRAKFCQILTEIGTYYQEMLVNSNLILIKFNENPFGASRYAIDGRPDMVKRIRLPEITLDVNKLKICKGINNVENKMSEARSSGRTFIKPERVLC